MVDRFKVSDIVESLSNKYCEEVCYVGSSGYKTESICNDCIVERTIEYVRSIDNVE